MALPVIGKFSTARSVCTPKYALCGTARSPRRSCSMRVSDAIIESSIRRRLPRRGADSFGRLAHRLEDRFELRAHLDAERAPRRQLAQEPLLVEPRELARFGEFLERALDERGERRVVAAEHDPVRVVRQV